MSTRIVLDLSESEILTLVATLKMGAAHRGCDTLREDSQALAKSIERAIKDAQKNWRAPSCFSELVGIIDDYESLVDGKMDSAEPWQREAIRKAKQAIKRESR